MILFEVFIPYIKGACLFLELNNKKKLVIFTWIFYFILNIKVKSSANKNEYIK